MELTQNNVATGPRQQLYSKGCTRGPGENKLSNRMQLGPDRIYIANCCNRLSCTIGTIGPPTQFKQKETNTNGPRQHLNCTLRTIRPGNN